MGLWWEGACAVQCVCCFCCVMQWYALVICQNLVNWLDFIVVSLISCLALPKSFSPPPLLLLFSGLKV